MTALPVSFMRAHMLALLPSSLLPRLHGSLGGRERRSRQEWSRS